MGHANDVAIFKTQNKKKRNAKALLEKSKAVPNLIGDSGLKSLKLTDVTSEFDPLLLGREGSIKFSEMSKSDGIVSGILSAYKNLILSCNWTLQEIEDITPEEQTVMDTIHNWFFTKIILNPHLILF